MNNNDKKKTRVEDFFEKFPNAEVSDDGAFPATCAAYVYGKDVVECSLEKFCEDCWNEEVPE